MLGIGLSMSMLFWISIGHAATNEQEKRIAQCPDGQYSGPGTGARRFLQDPYVWFVSREFAKHFCMPEALIDDSLKGALAVAVRLKPSEEITCGMYMERSDQCPVKTRLLLDIYVDNHKANIPKADPSVEYYAGWIWNSARFTGNDLVRSQQRYEGKITETPGERRPFSPATTRTIDRKDWTMFKYLGVRKGWATGAGEFIEDYYRENWVDGIDLISLDAYNFGYGDLSNPDLKVQNSGRRYKDDEYDAANPIQRWAIGVILGKDYLRNPSDNKSRGYPSDYLHTIELPHKVAQMIYAYDHKQGDQFFSTIKRAITPAPASTSPAQ